MSELILSQLKSKPKPATQQENKILVKLEKKEVAIKDNPVVVNVPIKNLVEESNIDRSIILEKLKIVTQSNDNKSVIKSKTAKKEVSEDKSDKPTVTPGKKTKKLKLVTIHGDVEKLPDKPRTTRKPTEKVIAGPKSLLEFKELTDRLPDPAQKIIIKAPAYYQNNREIFINFTNSLFEPYKKEIEENLENYSCDKAGNNDFQLLFHQKIVRD